MNTSLLQTRTALEWRAKSEGVARPALSPTLLRTSLMVGCALAAAIAVSYGSPDAYIRTDRELALLLRAMAVIKASLVIAAMSALWWRFGQPIGPGAAAAYLVGAFLIAAASGLIWQLTLIAPAAFAFHVGGFTLLVVAFLDRGTGRLITLSARARP